MKTSRFLFVPTFLIGAALIAQDAQVTPLMSKDLADFPGKEGLMITSVSSRLFGSDSSAQCACIRLRAGRLHCDAGERRERSHAHARPELVGRNASTTEPAKFVVFLVKNKDALAVPLMWPCWPATPRCGARLTSMGARRHAA